ncbi:hypothetical protein FDP41_011782 [Naegleria fowleri]|uniref:Uncharacterized protein n=1 Tax=Naegleria fowleri TaxID=5763 RepID=A0A6A5C4A4_NAEFO|nr:uncharacterized protein FDP41_011782 [Naegleria fowleri]KAF0981921.1 hypothetical protein FDP41_011782 [Naegleria fowleri]CAG4709816.1 unnamed protein product [Naegleria fowleri]
MFSISRSDKTLRSLLMESEEEQLFVPTTTSISNNDQSSQYEGRNPTRKYVEYKTKTRRNNNNNNSSSSKRNNETNSSSIKIARKHRLRRNTMFHASSPSPYNMLQQNSVSESSYIHASASNNNETLNFESVSTGDGRGEGFSINAISSVVSSIEKPYHQDHKNLRILPSSSNSSSLRQQQQEIHSIGTSVVSGMSRSNSVCSNNSSNASIVAAKHLEQQESVPQTPTPNEEEEQDNSALVHLERIANLESLLSLQNGQPPERFQIGIFGRNSALMTILFVLRLKTKWSEVWNNFKSTNSVKIDPTMDSLITTRPVLNVENNSFNLVSVEWIDMSISHNQYRMSDTEGFVFLIDISEWMEAEDLSSPQLLKSIEEQFKVASDVINGITKELFKKQKGLQQSFEEPVTFLCHLNESLYHLRDKELSSESKSSQNDSFENILATSENHFETDGQESEISACIRDTIEQLIDEFIAIPLDNYQIYIQDTSIDTEEDDLSRMIEHTFTFLSTRALNNKETARNRKQKKFINLSSSLPSLFTSSREEDDKPSRYL